MKSDLYVEAGKRIRLVREKKQYTREYVALKADISSKFLYEIEHGLKGFSADNLYKISKALEVNVEYILSGRTSFEYESEVRDVLSLFTEEQLKEIASMLKILYNTFN